MDQGNGYDCGSVHVCRYAYNLIQMVDLKVKNKDFTDNFASCISSHDLFDYNADDINRLRTQMHDLIVHITSLYRNHRDTVIDCLSESDDDDDDVEIIPPVTQTSDDSVDGKSDHVSHSDSSFSHLDDDDDDLSADTTGEFSLDLRLFVVYGIWFAAFGKIVHNSILLITSFCRRPRSDTLQNRQDIQLHRSGLQSRPR